MFTITRYVISDEVLGVTQYYSEKLNGYVEDILKATQYDTQIDAMNASVAVTETIIEISVTIEIK